MGKPGLLIYMIIDSVMQQIGPFSCRYNHVTSSDQCFAGGCYKRINCKEMFTHTDGWSSGLKGFASNLQRPAYCIVLYLYIYIALLAVHILQCTPIRAHPMRETQREESAVLMLLNLLD